MKIDLSKITQEEQKAFMHEFQDILQEYLRLEKREIQMLRETGKWKGGLDGYYPELVALSKERDNRIAALKKRIAETIAERSK